jgi:gluconokinase
MFDEACNGFIMSSVVVITGVSGAGKSTVGSALASALGWDFFDADQYHSEDNVRRMSAGTPLTDAEREPWLQTLKALIDSRLDTGAPAVLACSALRERYREHLADGRPEVRFILLTVDAATLAIRMQNRPDHFMPPSLLRSQLDTLEEGGDLVVVDATQSVPDIVRAIRRELRLSESDDPAGARDDE